ncbi:MAG TPA: diacylglycerol kinase [Nakamurella sp.]
MITDVALLINPAAGRGRGRRVGDAAFAQLRGSGVSVRAFAGSGPDESARFARDAIADGCEALVVCGGDGIVHLALQEIAGTGVPLGVLPAGSGNDFARAVGIPVGDPRAAVAVVSAGHAVPVDLGRTASRWFGTVLAAGFDSRVNDRMNAMRWPRGRTRYHVAIVAELARFRPLPFVLELDGARHELNAMLVAVGNGSTYGGGMRICPGAVLDDGLFDVTVISKISRSKLVRLFPRVYPGTHVHRREVLTFRCATVTVSAPDVAAYADGEFVSQLPETCSVVAGAVRVLVPGAGQPSVDFIALRSQLDWKWLR